MNKNLHLSPNERACALMRTRHVFVRDLEVMMVVGVLEKEKHKPQKLVISVDMTVQEDGGTHNDQIENVVCYGEVVEKVQEICARGHVNLIETVAERIADACLEDRRVLAVRIRLEKPDIISQCHSVGIEIERIQPPK